MLISHILQLTKTTWFAAQALWHITTYPMGLDKECWRRKAACLGIAAVGIFPSLCSQDTKNLWPLSTAGWPAWAKDSNFSWDFVLQAWTFTMDKQDWFILSYPSPSNEIRALVSVKCSWITNAVGIGIAKTGKRRICSPNKWHYQPAQVKHWKTFQRGMLLLFKPYYFFT